MFDVEGILVAHVMTLSELSVYYAWIMYFTSYGSFSKLLVLHSKRVNTVEEYYFNSLLGHFNTTT